MSMQAIRALRAALDANGQHAPLSALELDLAGDSALTYDDDGRPVVKLAKCGTCFQRWNDAAISSLTPAPSARCPFEYEHEH